MPRYFMSLRIGPSAGVDALRPLQFRRPTGDLGGGPIGASLSIGIFPAQGQYNSPARKRFRQQWPIFELRVAQRNGPNRGTKAEAVEAFRSACRAADDRDG